MPFGSQSCEDLTSFLQQLTGRKSPMPFGSQSCEDTLARRLAKRTGLSHQCLSAVSPVRTQGMLIDLFLEVASPMPFGSQSCEDPLGHQTILIGTVCHQCLSAVSPVRTKFRNAHAL